jgi:hypothetical protein
MNVDELKAGDVVVTAAGLERTVKHVTRKQVYLVAPGRKARAYGKTHPVIMGLKGLKGASTNGNGNGEVGEPELLAKCAHQFILAYYVMHTDEILNFDNVVAAFLTEVTKVLR